MTASTTSRIKTRNPTNTLTSTLLPWVGAGWGAAKAGGAAGCETGDASADGGEEDTGETGEAGAAGTMATGAPHLLQNLTSPTGEPHCLQKAMRLRLQLNRNYLRFTTGRQSSVPCSPQPPR